MKLKLEIKGEGMTSNQLVLMALLFLTVTITYFAIIPGKNHKADIGLVFGYGQLANGDLLPQTKARCKIAADSFRNGKVERLAITCFVETDKITMGKKMKEYLLSKGVPKEKIVLDEHGTNTAGEIDTFLKHLRPTDTITGFSNYYHLPRIWFLFATRGWNVSLTGTIGGINMSDFFWEPIKMVNAICRPKSWSKIVN